MLVIWQPLQGQVPPLCPLNPTPVQRVGEENPSWWSVAWFLLSISIDQLQSVSWQGFNTPIQVTLRCPDFLASESCCEVPSTNSSHNKKMHEKFHWHGFGSCPWTRSLQKCSRPSPCWHQPGLEGVFWRVVLNIASHAQNMAVLWVPPTVNPLIGVATGCSGSSQLILESKLGRWKSENLSMSPRHRCSVHCPVSARPSLPVKAFHSSAVTGQLLYRALRASSTLSLSDRASCNVSLVSGTAFMLALDIQFALWSWHADRPYETNRTKAELKAVSMST